MQNLPGHLGDGADCKPFPEATAILTIDLDALAENYRFLRDQCPSAECSAVVKADAYGAGLEQAVARLTKVGCKTFFVANLTEAQRLRSVNKDARVFVLGGLLPDTGPLFSDINAIPVLNSIAEIEDWQAYVGANAGVADNAAIQIDTGMNRLGAKPEDLKRFHNEGKLTGFTIDLLMSHLACADEPDHPLSVKQLEIFRKTREFLPDVPASLCNSAGIFLGEDYQFDLVRPGIALYGGRARNGVPNPMKPVVRLDARIAQLQEAPAGETVGYGAVETLKRPTLIATLSMGYADGYFRYLGSTDAVKRGRVFVDDQPVQILGRVSMDLITIDVTGIDEARVARGNLVEVMGPHMLVDDVADIAGTIGYEVLTNLGQRYQRIYRDV